MGAACVSCRVLQPDEQLRIKSLTAKSVRNGPGVVVVGFGKTGSKTKAMRLGPTEYLVVEDELSGDLRLVKGPRLFFPGAYDSIKGRRTAVTLAQNEYVKLQNTQTGAIRVERGEKIVYVEPLEEFVKPTSRAQPSRGNVWLAFEIDLETVCCAASIKLNHVCSQTCCCLFPGRASPQQRNRRTAPREHAAAVLLWQVRANTGGAQAHPPAGLRNHHIGVQPRRVHVHPWQRRRGAGR